MSTRANLIAARALIAEPTRWLKEDYENDGCYCVIGAVLAVTNAHHEIESIPEIEAIGAAIPRLGVQPFERHEIENWNDQESTTHADVMAVFDRAIEAASDV